MNKKTKKQNPILEPKTLIVTGLASLLAILVAVIMTALFLPKEELAQTSFTDDIPVSSLNEQEHIDFEEETEQAITTMNESEDIQDTSQPEADVFILPVNGAITKDYSDQELVYSKTMQDFRTHNGIDISANEGDDVVAVAEGTIESINDDGMYGTTVIILHKDGLRSIYSNLMDNLIINVGDAVAKGGIIGKVGSTAAAEIAEPTHLHFEMSLNEEIINPHDYLKINDYKE